MHSLIRDYPFALVVTLASDGLNANHIPMLLDPEPAPFGTLRGHVARANRIWQDFSPQAGALAVFQGPQTYITPSWYPTKKELGMAVPTWNYAVVHAQGLLKVIEDRSGCAGTWKGSRSGLSRSGQSRGMSPTRLRTTSARCSGQS
jgi:transcriptional regulator